MSHTRIITQIDREIRYLQGQILQIPHHNLHSLDIQSKSIYMINRGLLVYGGDSIVGYNVKLLLNVEATGDFTIFHGKTRLGSGTLRDYREGVSNKINKNPSTAAKELIDSNFEMYEILVDIKDKSVFIQASNSASLLDIARWHGGLTDTGNMQK